MQTFTRNPLPVRNRVRVCSTPDGIAVQVYGQTVMRAASHSDAVRKAAELRQILG